MPVVVATAEQQAQLQAATVALEQQMLGTTAGAVASRYAFWRQLAPLGLPAAVVALNARADADARSYAALLQALQSGRLVIVGWALGSETGSLGPVQLGVAAAGVEPSSLGQWQILPVIIRVAVQVVAGVGAWVIANAWTHAKEQEAKADQARATTQAAVTAAVAALAKTNPQAAVQLADALSRANTAASGATPGLLDSLASAVKDVGSGVGSGLSSGLLWVALAWMFLRRGHA